jgi:hypothetical protein
MRTHRKRHSELDDEARGRANARAYLTTYVSRGKVKKGPCCVCGSDLVEAHHDNYDKPLDVVWLCRTHHLELHATHA